MTKKYEVRINDLESVLFKMKEEIETNVLEKVAEMLTDNIYDIIPGYSELETSVQDV